MQEGIESKDLQDETYILYTKAISLFEMIKAQYNEDMKQSFDLAVYEILRGVYSNKEVYTRVLQYMRDEDIYARHIKPILEIQFNTPQPQSVMANSQPSNKNDEQQTKEQKTEDSNIATDVQKNKNINQDYIRRLFDIDE